MAQFRKAGLQALYCSKNKQKKKKKKSVFIMNIRYDLLLALRKQRLVHIFYLFLALDLKA